MTETTKKKAKRKPEKSKVSVKMKLIGKKRSKKTVKKKKTAAKKPQKQKISTTMKLNKKKSPKKIIKKKKTVKNKSEKKKDSTKIKSVKKKLALKTPKKKKALKSKVKGKKIIKKVLKKRKMTTKNKATKKYDEVYQILLIQRADLLKLISKSSSREQNISELEHGNVEDMAASSLEREMTFAMGSREREEFFMINDAMKKIANGVYGKCESCGQNINIKRLKIVPFSEYCMECKSNMEGGMRNNVSNS